MQFRKTALSIAVSLCAIAASTSSVCTQGTFPGRGSRSDWLKANGSFAEGNQFFEAKKYAQAVAKYKAAIAVYPSDYHYYLNLGLAEKKQGDINAACEAFRQGTEINPRDWRLWKGLGNCLYQTRQRAAAKNAFEQALSAQPPAQQIRELRAAIAACLHK